jgi:hypothetical protein
MREKVRKVAKDYGTQVRLTRGTGELFGSFESREAGIQGYRSFLRQYHGVGGRHLSGRDGGERGLHPGGTGVAQKACFASVLKFNPNHDFKTGQFTSEFLRS